MISKSVEAQDQSVAPIMKEEDDVTLTQLQSACSELKALMQTSAKMQQSLSEMDKMFDVFEENMSVAAKRIAPLQSSAMITKALETRINRAVSPALALLDSFKISDSLQHELLELSSNLSTKKAPEKRLRKLIEYVDCVDQLNDVISSICQEGQPVIQKLQEVVEFISRTKATDQHRANRLRETLMTLKALYEREVDEMRFDGLLDKALLSMQDEFEILLDKIKHQNITVDHSVSESETQATDRKPEDGMAMARELGSELEIEVLRRMSETLAANDCLDICIDMYIKARYTRTAKALMRVNPDYLRTYSPEEIDEMEWESLETAISLWIQHFALAVQNVLVSEKRLCNKVLGKIMDGAVWPECFVKISDKIMAVFFRFGEGVSRSSKEPQKLFKLLDIFDSLEKIKPEFSQVFEDEAGEDICIRFRELEKLLIHASSKVFWEFGLQIEESSDMIPPPQDGSVPKLVRYAINYLKYLVSDHYIDAMNKVLETEKMWKSGMLSEPELDEYPLRDAIVNVMEALQRNVHSKKSRFRDRILGHLFTMNTCWYIYMRTKNTELSKLLGETYMKKKYKGVAEEAAYLYQKQAWGPIIKMLELDELKKQSTGALASMVRLKIESFLQGFEEMAQRHKRLYRLPDTDLREQIRQATVQFVVTPYAEFLEMHSAFLKGKHLSPDKLRSLVGQIFEGSDSNLKSNSSIDRKQNSVFGDRSNQR